MQKLYLSCIELRCCCTTIELAVCGGWQPANNKKKKKEKRGYYMSNMANHGAKWSVYAPLNGQAVALEQVPDEVFSEKVLGDGLGIIPSDGKVYSPVNGEISSVAEMLHAYGFESDDGLEILVHVGLDTVALKGEGFKSYVNEGDKVCVGDLVAEVDLELLKKKGINPITPVLVCDGGVSMSIHESQSRFFENIIGRSEPFCNYVFPKIQELFPEQMKDVDAEMFYRGINKAEPSLIRTEADELTYCLHIMVRYELEKQLIAGSLCVKDIPDAWNRMYKDYLGIDVPNDKEGCLQDSHWSGGMFGYFPSYALGSAYGPQMLHQMELDIGSVWEDVAKGDVSGVKDWLKEHIHQHAGFYKPEQLFEMACGKFDAGFYTVYLTDKFGKLYNL